MSTTTESAGTGTPPQAFSVPAPILIGLRGVGQVFFQENALTGALFLAGIALSSPLLALAAIVGAAIGPLVAWALKFDAGELRAGIYGFNSTLVGIATLFFYQTSATTIALMVAGCAASVPVTWLMRKYVPFPTYTSPFIVVTWVVLFLAKTLGAAESDLSAPPWVRNPEIGFYTTATMNSIGQVMFQGSIWTGLFFLVGIAVSDQRHAGLVLIGGLVGVLVAVYHFTLGARAIDPYQVVDRQAFDVIKLGLYGFNATLAPVAIYLWRKSLIAPILGMMLTVPLSELVPEIGLVALTAPFVLATWIVLALGWLETHWLTKRSASM